MHGTDRSDGAGTSSSRLGDSSRGAFSLIELLTVILIIFVVLALVIPALDGARNVARSAATQSVMKEFGNAVDQFRLDRDQATPGIYSPEEMGDPANVDTYGYTTMENVLLSLAGGVQSFESDPGDPWRDFGPSDDAHNDELYVNVDLMGANIESNPGYWTPPDKFMETQSRGEQAQQFSIVPDDAEIPDVVDAWGNPVMLWVENSFGPRTIEEIEDFAQIDNDERDQPARFYWAANAGHLKAVRLGRGGEDQTQNSARQYSLLGEGNDEQDIRITMTALLGSPAFPASDADFDAPQGPDEFLPGDSRGRLVMHSTGIDGVYLGTEESGAKRFDAAVNGLPYRGHFFSNAGTRWERDSSPITRDTLEGFDDMVQTFGN